MSKLANPWKCDASGCGMLRANDTNHWLLLSVLDNDGGSDDGAKAKYVVIMPWDDQAAETPGAKHACGIDCCLKVAAQLIVDNFYPAAVAAEPGNEVQRG